jgi:hypothetical protein
MIGLGPGRERDGLGAVECENAGEAGREGPDRCGSDARGSDFNDLDRIAAGHIQTKISSDDLVRPAAAREHDSDAEQRIQMAAHPRAQAGRGGHVLELRPSLSLRRKSMWSGTGHRRPSARPEWRLR